MNEHISTILEALDSQRDRFLYHGPGDVSPMVSETMRARRDAIDAARAWVETLAELKAERDAALFTLMQHNPDALAGEVQEWVKQGKDELAKLKAQPAAGEWEDVPREEPFNAQGDYVMGTGQGLCIWLKCTVAGAIWHGVPLGDNMRLQRRKQGGEEAGT